MDTDNLFLAILALDAYNRGINPAIGAPDNVGLGGVGTQLGTATFFDQSSITNGAPALEAGFYAAVAK